MSEAAAAMESPQQAARRLSAQARRDGFEPEALHVYTSAAGSPLFWRVRLKHPDGRKWIRPMRRTADGAGYELGEPPAPAAGKPLYNLHRIAAAADGVTIVITEGEKAADALGKLGIIATTSGGASSASAADWTPLQGRTVLIWPDHDEPGAQYGREVAARLLALGCEVRIIDVAALGLPPKADAWDWCAAHQHANAAEVLALPTLPLATPATPALPPQPAPDVELLSAADLEPQAVRWVWPGWLAAGKLHILAGSPGTGKTTIALSVIAAITSGRALPDGHIPKRGRALIWSGEDDPADTLVPRLLAAGADLSRVHFIGSVNSKGTRYTFDPSKDVDALSERLANERDVSIILIDPIVSAVAADSHKNAEVRRSLQPLVDMAASINAALIGITHYTKGTAGRDPLERVTGSLAFGALARIVWGTVRQQGSEDTDRRMTLARAKSNLGPDGGGFAYAFEQAEPKPGIVTSRIRWGEALEGTARELLSEPLPDDGEGGLIDDAIGFLRGLLEDGPMPTKRIQSEATGAGHNWKTVRYAKDRLGVEARRDGFGKGGVWVWALPPDHRCPSNPIDAHPKSMGTYGETWASMESDPPQGDSHE
ncbi:MAG: AAA family ATPase [Thiomonas sp.]|uniref:AAA family ATPase n=1 Tax=Thiomonas sp. TaxID=2047785 RepID=UPI002A35A1C6|nr:AAA family ATPase [Thiomonas sp.]MDY0331629.1 AAA family ATPase [Thiomonas sp.]